MGPYAKLKHVCAMFPILSYISELLSPPLADGNSLEFRHSDSDGLGVAMANTDVYVLNASFTGSGFGVAVKLSIQNQ